MKNNFTQKIAAGLVMIVLWFSTAYSQEDSSKLERLTLRDLLNVKVTTASKVSQNLETAPSTIIVITREQIKARGYQSLLDVMYDLPDVKVDDKIYTGSRNNFTIRGTMGSEKFVIMLDGVSISSPSGEALPLMENYPVNFAEQIEVVYGPASALYGANAVSGIINIISKKLTSWKDILVEASTVGGTYGYANSSLFISKRLNEHVSFTFSGQYAYDKGVDYTRVYKNDPLMDISSHVTGTFNTIYGPMTPLKPVKPAFQAPTEAYNIYTALRTDDFVFSIFKNYTRIPTAWGNNPNNAVFNKEVYIAQAVTVANAVYKRTFGNMTSTTSMGLSGYNLDPQSNYRNLFTAMETGYKYATTTMTRAEQQLDFKVSAKLNFSGGVSYENYTSIPQSADLSEPVNIKENIQGVYLGTTAYYNPGGLAAQFYFIRYHNIGSYLQAQFSPSEKIHFTLGARFDNNSRYGNTFNPRMGFVYKPSERTTIKALYGSAYLAPSPSDSYSQYGSFETADSGRTYHSYFLHLPNPGLKPIRSQNVELSIHQYLTENLSFSLNAYYTALSGLHESSDDSEATHLYNNSFNGIAVDYIEVLINEAKQKNYGGSLQVNWKYAVNKLRFNSFAILSYVNGRVQDPIVTTGEYANSTLDFISPLMFRLGTEVKYGNISFAPRLLVMSRQNISGFIDNPGKVAKRQTIPGYALLNLSLKYDMAKKFSLFMNISNALNQKYRSVSYNIDLSDQNTFNFYGQPEDPIRITGGFHFSF